MINEAILIDPYNYIKENNININKETLSKIEDCIESMTNNMLSDIGLNNMNINYDNTFVKFNLLASYLQVAGAVLSAAGAVLALLAPKSNMKD